MLVACIKHEARPTARRPRELVPRARQPRQPHRQEYSQQFQPIPEPLENILLNLFTVYLYWRDSILRQKCLSTAQKCSAGGSSQSTSPIGFKTRSDTEKLDK